MQVDDDKGQQNPPDRSTENTDDKGDAEDKRYTKADMDRKLAGPGKRIKQLEEELAKERDQRTREKDAEDAARVEAKRKQLEDDGKTKELLEMSQKEGADKDALIADLAKQVGGLEGDLRGVIEGIDASNKESIKRIPKDMRGLVPEDYDPRALSAWLTKNLPALVPKEQVVNVSGGPVVGAKNADPSDWSKVQARFAGKGNKS
ncbi:MAG: hypothetical protein GY835_24015 [bacterium]|nr:hypothetical protein [bacterium]